MGLTGSIISQMQYLVYLWFMDPVGQDSTYGHL